MNKDFQLAVLRRCAQDYPKSILYEELREAFPDGAEPNKLHACVSALEEVGYLKDHSFQEEAYRITVAGLLAIGVDILHPDPNAELVLAIRELTQAVRALRE